MSATHRTLLALALVSSLLDAARADTPGSAIDARKGQMIQLDRRVDGFSAEGTSVTAWASKGRIEKIEVVALGEQGRVLLDFWWQGARLLAARERRIDYGAPITALPQDAPTPMNLVQDDLLVFRADALTRWTRAGQDQRLKANPEAADRTRVLRAQARSFHRLMTTPAPRQAPDQAACDWQCSGRWGIECAAFRCR